MAEPLSHKSQKPEVRKNPLRLLLVEDHPADAELCQLELRNAGLEADSSAA